MKKLEKDWLTDKWIDFEYKKYILLAYLNNIKQAFGLVELYPGLSDAIAQYRYLKEVRLKIDDLSKEFPRTLVLEELKKWKMTYAPKMNDETINELMRIIDFSIPKIQDVIEEGKEIYEFVEQDMSIEPIGVEPLYTDEGYLLTRVKTDKIIAVYRYEIRLFNGNEPIRGVSLRLLQKMKWSFSATFRSIKVSLARYYQDLPNPATYLVTSTTRYPDDSTFLPIAKRMLVSRLVN